MASIRKEIVIDASPEEVWAAVSDVGAVHRRLVPGYAVETRLDGDVRILTMPSGDVVRELIVDVDDESRRLAYAVIETRMPLEHHHASLRVVAEGDYRSRLIWITDALPHALSDEIRVRVDRAAEVIKQTLEDNAENRSQEDRTTLGPDRFVGTWILVPGLCLYESGPVPASGVYEIAERDGTIEFSIRWTMEVGGQESSAMFAGPPDGTVQPFLRPEGAPAGTPDGLRITRVDAATLDSEALVADLVVAHARRTASDDGALLAVMQESRPGGEPGPRNFQVYRRASGGAAPSVRRP